MSARRWDQPPNLSRTGLWFAIRNAQLRVAMGMPLGVDAFQSVNGSIFRLPACCGY